MAIQDEFNTDISEAQIRLLREHALRRASTSLAVSPSYSAFFSNWCKFNSTYLFICNLSSSSLSSRRRNVEIHLCNPRDSKGGPVSAVFSILVDYCVPKAMRFDKEN